MLESMSRKAAALPDTEARMSRLCAWVLMADKLGLQYGLRMASVIALSAYRPGLATFSATAGDAAATTNQVTAMLNAAMHRREWVATLDHFLWETCGRHFGHAADASELWQDRAEVAVVVEEVRRDLVYLQQHDVRWQVLLQLVQGARIDTRNHASIALVQRLGFRQVQLIRNAAVIEGAPNDEYVFSRRTELSI